MGNGGQGYSAVVHGVDDVYIALWMALLPYGCVVKGLPVHICCPVPVEEELVLLAEVPP